MAAVRLALHVRTRYRAEFASPGSQSAGYGRAVRKARTPSMAAPAPSGLTSGLPIFSGDRSGIARLRAPELRARKHMVGPCHGRAAAIGAHDARLRVRRHDREIVGRRRVVSTRVQIDTYDLFGAWARTFGKSRDQRPKQFRPRPIRQQRSRDMLVKAPLESPLTVLLDDKTYVGRLEVRT